MKRAILLLVLAGCSVSCSAAPVGAPRASSTTPTANPSPEDTDGYGSIVFCDPVQGLTVQKVVSDVGRPHAGRAAAEVQLLRVGPPRWNTPEGNRPTKAQEEAARNLPLERQPWIYTPLEVRVDRVIRGPLSRGSITIYADAGQIGKDKTDGCAFSLRGSALVIRGGPETLKVGASYLAILGREMLDDSTRIRMPVISDLFSLHSDLVVGYEGKLEPIPR